jgi:hypothetical protein|mmetsp:Transcript_3282/g.6266  ORF Transcript_3282/g.6266 Transcript_3282/m.6266 type:complete len:152 (-) Transcript_3282:1839-2294(-)
MHDSQRPLKLQCDPGKGKVVTPQDLQAIKGVTCSHMHEGTCVNQYIMQEPPFQNSSCYIITTPNPTKPRAQTKQTFLAQDHSLCGNNDRKAINLQWAEGSADPTAMLGGHTNPPAITPAKRLRCCTCHERNPMSSSTFLRIIILVWKALGR